MTLLLVLLAVSAAAGFLLGTEAGRQQKELILVKLGRKDGEPIVEEALIVESD